MRSINILKAIPLILIAFWVIGVGYAQQPPVDQPVGLSINSQARQGDSSGNPIDVTGQRLTTVHVNLEGGMCSAVTRQAQGSADVALVVDVSGSMEWEMPNSQQPRIDATQIALRSFSSRLDMTYDRVALIPFHANASIAQPLTNSLESFLAQVDNLRVDGGTNIARGITAATNHLLQTGRPDAVKAIILLTDGYGPDARQAMTAANNARNEGFRVFTIGIGTEDSDRSFLQDIADEPNMAFFSTTQAELENIYTNIASLVIPSVSAENLAITYTVDEQSFRLLPDSVFPPATVTGNQIVWHLSSLQREDIETFRFDVEALFSGVNTMIVGEASVTFNPCPIDGQISSNPERQIRDIGPSVTLVLPTPTPTPTFTPTPTNTPTPTPTFTPTPSAVEGGMPIGTPTTGGNTGGVMCADDFLTFILLPLMIALIFALVLFYVYWRIFGNNESFIELFRRPCFWVRLPLLLFLPILVFLFIRPVTASFCEPAETIYFWRMESNTGGIFMTHENFSGNTPVQIRSLNEQGCVGCHTINSEHGLIVASNGPIPGRMTGVEFDGTVLNLPNIDAVYMSISPDGTQVVYNDSNADLYILDLINGSSRRLEGASNESYGAVMPSWSPTNDIIAFVGAPRGNIRTGLTVHYESDIYTISPAGGSPMPVIGASANGYLNYYPSISPDGRYIAYTAHNNVSESSYSAHSANIWIANRDTGNSEMLRVSGGDYSDSWATWSRDGTQLAFNTTRADVNYDIYIVEMADGQAVGMARPLSGASEQGVFEHLPYWGAPVQPASILDQWRELLPALLPLICLIPFAMLCMLFRSKPMADEPEITPPPPPPPLEPIQLGAWEGPQPLWDAQPTLIIGIGKSAWHVLTNLKKTLYDVSLGDPDPRVNILSLLTGNHQQKLDDKELGAGMLLNEDEVFYFTKSLQSFIKNAPNDPIVSSWLDPNDPAIIANQQDPKRGLQRNRVLGRATLLDNIRTEKESSNVWEVIKQAAQRSLTDDRGLNVVIVSDLADDLGSGSVIDVAFMSRRLQQALGLEDKVRVVGHLITERDFDGGSDAVGSRNMLITLRELERFQMYPAPYSMIYGVDDLDDPQWQEPLFKEFFLYDKSISDKSPLNSTYPAIADLIALSLDSATLRGNFAGYRENCMNGTDQVRMQDGRMAFSTQGIYQIRLPYNDILQNIVIRYAVQVLHLLLLGDQDQSVFRLSEYAQKGQDRAVSIFRGQLGSPQVKDGRVTTILNALYLRDIETAKSRHVNVDLEHDRQALYEWLLKVLMLILNGQSKQNESIDADDYYARKRSGKIGLAYATLHAIYKQSEVMIQDARQADLDSHLIDLLMGFHDDVKQMFEQIKSLANKLGVQDGIIPNDSIYGLLLQEYKAIQTRVKATHQISSREIITHDPKSNRELTDIWYEEYVLDHVKESLKAIAWSIVDGELKLTILLPNRIDAKNGEDRIVIFDVEDIHKFGNALLEVGHFYAKDIRQKAKIKDFLGQRWMPGEEANTAKYMKDRSKLLLNTQEPFNNHVLNGLILSAYDSNMPSNTFKNHLQDHNTLFLNLFTTDPFSITVARSIDGLQIEMVKSVEGAKANYLNNTWDIEPVFRGEIHALYYESRLSEIKTPKTVLHPVVVSALDHRIQTEAFLLLSVVMSKQLRITSSEVIYQPDDGAPITLVGNINRLITGSLLSDALLTFIDVIDEQTASNLITALIDQDGVLDLLDEWEQSGYEKWDRTWPSTNNAGKVILEHLTYITRLRINKFF